jgi:TonB family protein
VSSATNTLPPGAGAEGKLGGSTPRPNPVALEVMVSVTGTKVTANAPSRDLFSEETTTVLVFKDGAVIRLAATVNAGQLLFLTSKKNNQEVVCQVLHRKPISENSSYVELKFTEERKDYWGVAFPQEAARAPEFRIAEQKQAEAMTAQALEPTVEPHSAQDVDELKLKVEALREQLEALQKNNAAEAAARAMAEASTVRENAKRQATLREASKVVDELMGNEPESSPAPTHATPAEQPPPEEKPDLLMPSAPKDVNEVARAVVNMSLPVWKMELSPEEQLLEEEKAHELANSPVKAAPVVEEGNEERSAEIEAADASLPKPALDFSNVPKDAKKSVRGASVPTLGGAGKGKTIGLVAVLALALVGGAWYGKVWTLLPFGKKDASASQAKATRPVVRSAPKTATPGAGAAPAGATATPVSDAATRDAAKPDGTPATTDSTKDTGASANGNPATSTPPAEEPVHKTGKGKRSGETENSNTAATNAAESVPADAPAVAAKLLKQANPVYPPDAMRSYITGDVKAEVTVGPNGRVSKVNVISGPKALRDAAVEALKQYEYAPATQGGKPVESKTAEVVKFWFNP